MKKWIFWLCLLYFGCQSNDQKPTLEYGSFIDHLTEFEANHFSISTDFQKIIETKDAEKASPATLLIADNCPIDHKLEIKLSSRGITRKNHCEFPPLKLNLLKNKMPEELKFDKFPSYKLVTHCKLDSAYRNYLIREYTSYKLLNVLTEKSLQVKYLDINYQDQVTSESSDHIGFLIENIGDFGRRIQGKVVDDKTPISKINKEQYQLIVLFQYMIGNTDWSLSQRHNVEFVQLKDEEIILVPYDFDYAGLVNAKYAVPHPQLPIKHVTERMLQYRGKHTDELELAIQIINSRKADLYNTLEVIQKETNSQLEDVKNYLDSFFEIINTPSTLQESFEAVRRNI